MSNFHRFYIAWCAAVSVAFATAGWSGVRAPKLGFVIGGPSSSSGFSSGGSSSSGRSSGGFWGGGK